MLCSILTNIWIIFLANLLLQDTIERIHVGEKYGDIPRGIFLVRGENMVLMGEIVSYVESEVFSKTIWCVSSHNFEITLVFLPFSLGKKFILVPVTWLFGFDVGGHWEYLSHMLVELVTNVIRVLNGPCYC